MANVVVKAKDKVYIDEELRWKIAKIVGLPPRLVLRRKDRVEVIVNKNEKGLFIGRNGIVVRRLENEIGMPVRVLGVEESIDALSSLNI